MQWLGVIIVLFSIFVSPNNTFAQEVIENFQVNLQVRSDGTMQAREEIRYDFGSDNRHGIFRTIPTISTVGELYRKIGVNVLSVKRNGMNEAYQITKQGGNLKIKIGDANTTITGSHSYQINYEVSNGIGSNYADHDEIYWNVTGNNWPVPIKKVAIDISTDTNISAQEAACYTGEDSSHEQNCTILQTQDGYRITTTELGANQGLTVAVSYPVGTFPKSILQTSEPVTTNEMDPVIIFAIYLIVLLGLNVVAPVLIWGWYQRKKSQTKWGAVGVNFDLPKDSQGLRITPAEAGIIDNTILEQNDVTATIFDLAIRKYIKIKEEKKVRALMPDTTDYKIIKLKDYQDLNQFEITLLNRLFVEGDEVLLKDLKGDFYKTFSTLESEAFKLLVNRKFYTKNPKYQKNAFKVLGIVMLGTFNIVIGILLIYLSKKLNGRTNEGDKLNWQIDGLKIFLKSMSRHHGWQAKNLITVERYIPYALAFGLHEEFMSQLEVLYPSYEPGWYTGQTGFYNFYPTMYTSMHSNITTAAPSSSSGFSSGGSSGGGGGGGGGGSW